MDPLAVLRKYCKAGKMEQVVMAQADDPRPVVRFGSEYEYDRRKPIALCTTRGNTHELADLVHLLKLRSHGKIAVAGWFSSCKNAGVEAVDMAYHDVRAECHAHFRPQLAALMLGLDR
jgi:hypothetical protein